MTLQACLVETIRLMGDNTYKVPHMSKEKKERKGLVPKNVMCPRDVYAAAKNQLLAVDGAELDRALVLELKESRSIHELAALLEKIALKDAESDVINETIEELGIELISVDVE
ncbi:hypothetical protein AaE_014447 [Aphanomyces astaci]|uniref:Uncharacterized protein n=1 Tax=Aphanomyces astaci TaxID=112090 RepID=A0A6A4ZDN2_APHAT|nr:hypothetical protein AaE_014447 [Aphanomyces astaci]